MMIVPLQLKIKNFYNELNTLKNNNRVENVEKYEIILLN